MKNRSKINPIDWNSSEVKEIIEKVRKNDSKMNGSNEVDVDHVYNTVKKFYSRHVNNLTDIRHKKGEWILKGDSPFGDGYIYFNREFGWYCEATNEKGDDIEFLRKENPFLTDRGANAAAIAEMVDTVDFEDNIILDNNSFRNELRSYRESVVNDDKLNADEKAKFLKNNFWVTGVSKFKYMEVSRTNSPICRYEWNEWNVDEVDYLLIHGVPRIQEHPDASRIYFVKDPLHLMFLKETVNDPIYIRPDNNTFSYNDYHRMVRGKEVVFCKSVVPFSYTIEDMIFGMVDGNKEVDFFTFFGDEIY